MAGARGGKAMSAEHAGAGASTSKSKSTLGTLERISITPGTSSVTDGPKCQEPENIAAEMAHFHRLSTLPRPIRQGRKDRVHSHTFSKTVKQTAEDPRLLWRTVVAASMVTLARHGRVTYALHHPGRHCHTRLHRQSLVVSVPEHVTQLPRGRARICRLPTVDWWLSAAFRLMYRAFPN